MPAWFTSAAPVVAEAFPSYPTLAPSSSVSASDVSPARRSAIKKAAGL